MTSTGSVLAVQYDGGVLIACDTAVTYGSLAMIPNVSRCVAIGKHTAIASSGSYADFQHIVSMMQDVCRERELQLGESPGPAEIFTMLQRYMYDMRSEMKPLFSTIVVAGVSPRTGNGNKQFIGTVDTVGTHWTGKYAGTGYAQHIAIPLVREYIEKHGLPSCREDALDLLNRSLRVLFYRDCKSINRWLITDISDQGIHQAKPCTLDTNFSMEGFSFSKTALFSF